MEKQVFLQTQHKRATKLSLWHYTSKLLATSGGKAYKISCTNMNIPPGKEFKFLGLGINSCALVN